MLNCSVTVALLLIYGCIIIPTIVVEMVTLTVALLLIYGCIIIPTIVVEMVTLTVALLLIYGCIIIPTIVVEMVTLTVALLLIYGCIIIPTIVVEMVTLTVALPTCSVSSVGYCRLQTIHDMFASATTASYLTCLNVVTDGTHEKVNMQLNSKQHTQP